MADMSNEQIMDEFNSLFGSDEDETTEEETTEETEESTETEEESEETEDTETEETEDEENEEEPESNSGKNKQAQQNFAFAQQRQQIKELNSFVNDIGRLIGMDKAKPQDIINKAKEVLLEKQSKETGVPVEMLQRLEKAEALLEENANIKHQNEVQNTFAELIEKYSLTQEKVEEFTAKLIENGKNPMLDASVDVESEFIKLYYNELVKAAVDNAVNKEQERQKKVNEKAASSASGKSPDKGDPGKIESVKDLDNLFSGMSL